MNLFCTDLRKSFESKRIIKLITGIDNLNISNIIHIAEAAKLSDVSYLDVVANTKVVQLLKSSSSLPICVSSINPIDLYNCVIAGADLVEIGNFDFCYKQGIYLSSSELLKLVKQVIVLLPNIDICVTIPYFLSLNEQVKLAQKLESLGVNIIQTESFFIKNKSDTLNKPFNSTFSSIYPSFISLLSTYIISRYVNVPVIASSSINHLSSPIALLFGASGIGIGSAVSQQNNILYMYYYLRLIRSLVDSLCVSIRLQLNRKLLLFNFLDFYILNNLKNILI
uniref:Uncharacterized protein ycf23 n=1 Tax=Chondria tumulosa TaxID=2740715 RepID=A0A896SPS7_9FLOR|nr:hypothetical protein K8K75_pgp145 [Chondria tumulosa]QSD57062.1 hypothetical protein [Chondria tumulosa]